MKPCLKTRSDKRACANIFLELPLTNFGIILERMQHALTFMHSLLIHFALLTLTIMMQPPEQNSEAAMDFLLNFYANFTEKHLPWSLLFTKLQVFRLEMILQYTFFIFTNNVFFITQLKQLN